MRRSKLNVFILSLGLACASLTACGDDDTTSGDTTGGDTTGGDTTGGDTTGGDTTGGDTTAAGVYLDPTDDCPQRGGFFDVANADNFIDYNGDGNDNATTFSDSGLSPTLDVNCSGDEVAVTSNGVVNFDFYLIGLSLIHI